MIWYGMIWYGTLRYCMVRYGMVRYGKRVMVWYSVRDVVWYGKGEMQGVSWKTKVKSVFGKLGKCCYLIYNIDNDKSKQKYTVTFIL